MTTRGIRRKKSSLSEVKIGVLGAPTVGKSGMHSLNIFFSLLIYHKSIIYLILNKIFYFNNFSIFF